MKKQIIAVMASAMVILGGGAIASADSQTVKGEGDIVKIIGDNAKTAVTTRVFGFGEPCGGAKQFMVYVENRTGKIQLLRRCRLRRGDRLECRPALHGNWGHPRPRTGALSQVRCDQERRYRRLPSLHAADLPRQGARSNPHRSRWCQLRVCVGGSRGTNESAGSRLTFDSPVSTASRLAATFPM